MSSNTPHTFDGSEDVVIGFGAFGEQVLGALARQTTTRYPHGAPRRINADIEDRLAHPTDNGRSQGLWLIAIDSATALREPRLLPVIAQADRDDAVCVILLASATGKRRAILPDLIALISGLDGEPAAIISLDGDATRSGKSSRGHDQLCQAIAIINGLCRMHNNGTIVCVDLEDLRTVLARSGGYFRHCAFGMIQGVPNLSALHETEAVLFWMTDCELGFGPIREMADGVRQQCPEHATVVFGGYEDSRRRSHVPEVGVLTFCKLPEE